jgi:hypothetical protein
LKPKVEIIEDYNESSNNETDDNSHIEHSISIKPSKRTVTEAHGVEPTRSSKRKRKVKKIEVVGQLNKIKSKSVENVPILYKCLQKGCNQNFVNISDFEDHQIQHDSAVDVSDEVKIKVFF